MASTCHACLGCKAPAWVHYSGWLHGTGWGEVPDAQIHSLIIRRLPAAR